jgi:peptidoglycan/xylan/chitin deacetylase (PgdA/CDA1 family)
MMSPRSALSALRQKALCSFYPRTVTWGNIGPVVSFSFDDFPRSAYLAGGAILKNLGVRGTYYTAPGLMNTSNELGEQFCADDVRALLQDGHELASHTFGHLSGRAVSPLAFKTDVDCGRQAIEKIAGVADSGNFAYPYGHATLRTKKTLGPTLISSRSVIPGLNGPEVDLNLLRGNSLYGDVSQLEKTQALIRENEQRRQWLIFYTHDVCPNPSPYGCTATLLESTISYALQRGCRILTVQGALMELGVRFAAPSTARAKQPDALLQHSVNDRSSSRR